MHLELVSTPASEDLPNRERAPHERPRERMLLYGSAALADVELIALLLGGGRALQRAQLLLERVGGLVGLSQACPHELLEVPGIGDAGATALAAAVELRCRIDRLELPWGARLKSPREAETFLRSLLQGAAQEHFVVLGLDARQRVRMVRTVGVGTLSRVEVHPREVFRPLLRAGMHSCIIVHNHPSGDTRPSNADVDLTHRMVKVGMFLGLPVMDHIVISDRGFVSLAEAGLMDPDGDLDFDEAMGID
ncbi:RadC family protein [Nannocystaceae bacterium ST9]